MLKEKVSGVTAVEVKSFPVLSFDSDLTGEYHQFSGIDAKKVFIDFLLKATLYAPSVLKNFDVDSIVDCVFDLSDDTFESLLNEAGGRDTLLKILEDVDVSFIDAVFGDYDSDLAYQLLADVVGGSVSTYDSFESLLDSEFDLWGANYELLKDFIDWDYFCSEKCITHCGDYYFIW